MAHLGKLIDLYSYPVRTAMRFLLADKTTGENIIWATSTYERYGDGYRQDNQITPELISGVYANLIQPRILKAEEEQAARTKSKAEVFTPSWVVCYMNNKCDDDWVGRENVFNTLNGEYWEPTKEPVYFEKERDWQRYVDSRRLEITCGEAPYLVSRYDAATGEELPIESRIGILDRKLRVVIENTDNEADWLKWTQRAFESTYGYEYQGDNLLVARINLLMTFVDYMQERWRREPTAKELNQLANVICWNIWQMDGLKGMIPGKELYISDDYEQLSLFASDFEQETLFDEAAKQNKKYECKIRDWRAKKSTTYNDLRGEKAKMKFDYATFNPPYQESVENNGRTNPVYNLFMDGAYQVADVVEVITPARFLFNAGQTPKAWNEKMLNDEHFKVLEYEPDGEKIFQNADIKGGVAITIRSQKTVYGKIGTFTAYPELNSILRKATKDNQSFLSDITAGAVPYRYTDLVKKDHPEAVEDIGKSFDLRSNALDKMHGILFSNTKPQDGQEYVRIFGLKDRKRTYEWIRKDYIVGPSNFDKYKVLIPKSNGSGSLGEVLSTPIVEEPYVGHTQTFISMGGYKTYEEAENLLKYIKTKFCRILLGIAKITQDNSKATWKYVPVQNFKYDSDIDWSKSITEIDKQLYQKYQLSDGEIRFIESHGKEMK